MKINFIQNIKLNLLSQHKKEINKNNFISQNQPNSLEKDTFSKATSIKFAGRWSPDEENKIFVNEYSKFIVYSDKSDKFIYDKFHLTLPQKQKNHVYTQPTEETGGLVSDMVVAGRVNLFKNIMADKELTTSTKRKMLLMKTEDGDTPFLLALEFGKPEFARAILKSADRKTKQELFYNPRNVRFQDRMRTPDFDKAGRPRNLCIYLAKADSIKDSSTVMLKKDIKAAFDDANYAFSRENIHRCLNSGNTRDFQELCQERDYYKNNVLQHTLSHDMPNEAFDIICKLKDEKYESLRKSMFENENEDKETAIDLIKKRDKLRAFVSENVYPIN